MRVCTNSRRKPHASIEAQKYRSRPKRSRSRLVRRPLTQPDPQLAHDLLDLEPFVEHKHDECLTKTAAWKHFRDVVEPRLCGEPEAQRELTLAELFDLYVE